jgi:hypothetical protein
VTPAQVFTVAALGGLAGVLGLALFLVLALIVFAIVSRLVEARDARRERRRDLKTCRAIDALGTADPTSKGCDR